MKKRLFAKLVVALFLFVVVDAWAEVVRVEIKTRKPLNALQRSRLSMANVFVFAA